MTFSDLFRLGRLAIAMFMDWDKWIVVVTTPSLRQAADSLANIHAGLGKRVAVVMQQDVFDAFSSGTSDPTSIKMLMMMLRIAQN